MKSLYLITNVLGHIKLLLITNNVSSGDCEVRIYFHHRQEIQLD
jgi:hypothetical protein